MSKIEWTQETWNPILGCSKISAGCKNCYAINQAYRNQAIANKLIADGINAGRLSYYQGLTEKDNYLDWTGKLVFVPEALEIPLKRKKPTMYFVNSMSDLFHENVPDYWIDQIFAVMAIAKHHTFQILTKRPQRMKEYLSKPYHINIARYIDQFLGDKFAHENYDLPAPNIWLGTTCENQKAVAERLPILLQTPALVRFLSCEPLLEDIYLALNKFDHKPNWIIVGGESGNNARPCHLDWIRSTVKQCRTSNVPIFVKQLGSNVFYGAGNKMKLINRKGGDLEEFPEDLQIREFPN